MRTKLVNKFLHCRLVNLFLVIGLSDAYVKSNQTGKQVIDLQTSVTVQAKLSTEMFFALRLIYHNSAHCYSTYVPIPVLKCIPQNVALQGILGYFIC